MGRDRTIVLKEESDRQRKGVCLCDRKSAMFL